MTVHVQTDLEPDTMELDIEARQPPRIILQVEFDRGELAQLREAIGRGPSMIRFIKQAALEKADAEAQRRADQTVDSSVEAAD